MNSLLENSIEDIIDRYFLCFYYKNNVTGIGLGNKVIKGIYTEEPCLHVVVKKKLPINRLYKHDIIPKTFLGIKTDVIEAGKMKFFNSSWSSIPVSPSDLRKRVRPIYPGCSIGPVNERFSGTLGWIVFDNDGIPYILSNNHVLTDYNKLKKGRFIMQPSMPQGGNTSRNVVATLSNFINVKFTRNEYLTEQYYPNVPKNYADCAIAQLLPTVKYLNQNSIIGPIKGTLLPKVGMKVRSIGRSLGYSEGKITTIKYSTAIDITKDIVCIFKNQIISDAKTKEGDSGALVTDFNNRAVGLLYGGTDVTSFITPIDIVLKLLNIHF